MYLYDDKVCIIHVYYVILVRYSLFDVNYKYVSCYNDSIDWIS